MIETGRLLLRPWDVADRGAFGALVNTPAMMERLGGVQAETVVDAMFARRLDDQRRHGHCYWAVVLRETGVLVGTCGLRRADDYGDAGVAGMLEIGWRVDNAYWGQGIAREAAQASIGWAWTHTGDPAIGAWTTAANMRSWGLMERLGMARRPDLDFHHHRHAPDDPVGAMIVYVVERPR